MSTFSQVGLALRRMDWIMLLAVLTLLAIGVMFIYSASYRGEDVSPADFYQRQIIWAALGLFVLGLATVFDYRSLRSMAWWIYAACVLLLMLVLVAGQKRYGAVRWLVVFGFQLQPSELAKLAVVLALARFLARPGRDPTDPRVVFQVLATIGIPFALIAKEPDFGTAAILVPVAFVVMFVAGVPLRYLLWLAAAGVALMPVGWMFLGAYQRERILVFLDPARDPLGAGWNKIQSAIAVGSGGVTGKGFLKGTQNVLGFLPKTVAPTDFIYSVIAEEMGFLGSVGLIVLFLLLLGSCIRAALAARDRFGRLLATGTAALLFAHVFVNMAMTIGLLPITGLPLPLISYGGSFMLTTMAALGLVQSVYVRRISE
jgi:rod shape determining protein RodA